jgi:acetyltransferase-like isoleucine patch superfamily enzyme
MRNPTHTIDGDWFPRPLPRGVTVGERSHLASSYSCLHWSESAENRLAIGDDTGIYHPSFFELGPCAQVSIGSFSTMVGVIIRAEREVSIGNYVLIAHEVVITDCEHARRASVQRAATRLPPGNCEPRPVRIGNDVWIGMRAVILAGVTIGDGAIIGAGAVVSQHVPAHCIASGNPARIVRRSA